MTLTNEYNHNLQIFFRFKTGKKYCFENTRSINMSLVVRNTLGRTLTKLISNCNKKCGVVYKEQIPCYVVQKKYEECNLSSKTLGIYKLPMSISPCYYSTQSNIKSSEMKNEDNKNVEQVVTDNSTLSKKEKLKKAVKEYGSTVIIFHVGISLISLGTFYVLVSMGLDISTVCETFGITDWASNSKLVANAGTFAVAYAIHKIFAPARITITLGSVPFIVRYLRKKGILKK